MSILKLNLDVLFNGLTDEEAEMYEEMVGYFDRVLPRGGKRRRTHWEGVELERYWKLKATA